MLSNQVSKNMGWPFIIVYLLLILSAFYFTLAVLPKAINSNNWPQAQGQVTSSKLIQRTRTNKTGKRITVHSAKIQYQYNVDKNTFTYHQIKWANRHSSNQVEKDMQNQYPTGVNVTVFYNPENPSESVLQKGLSKGHILTGLFLLFSILAMAYAMFKNARRRRA